MTDQKNEFSAEEIDKQAKILALEFEKYARGKKWFKPLHIAREIRQTDSFVKDKLDVLVTLNYAVAKSVSGGDLKYCITVSDESRLSYLDEYLEYLKASVKEVEDEIKALEEK